MKFEPIQSRVDVDFSTLYLKKACLVRGNIVRALKKFHVKVDLHCRVKVERLSTFALNGSRSCDLLYFSHSNTRT